MKRHTRFALIFVAAFIAPTLMPVFAGVIGWAFLKERPGSARWLGYAAIILGLVSLVIAGAIAHGAPSPAGIGALAAAAAMWAIYTQLFPSGSRPRRLRR